MGVGSGGHHYRTSIAWWHTGKVALNLNAYAKTCIPTVLPVLRSGISQLYRSPDTTHLVTNLKEQNRELRNARDSIADELLALQKSTRATRTSELQSELFAAQQEVQRLQYINSVGVGRVCGEVGRREGMVMCCVGGGLEGAEGCCSLCST